MSRVNRYYRFLLAGALLIMLAACGSDSAEVSSTASPDTSGGSTGPLSRPAISTTQMEDSIVVYWDQSNAAEYRVIYWRGSDIPSEHVTSDLEYVSPPLVEPGEYIVIVEAYDEQGNSLFSDPSIIEII